MVPKVWQRACCGQWGEDMQVWTRALRRGLLRLLRDSSGPTAVEYALLLALIVLVAMGAIQVIGEDWEKAIFVQLAQHVPS